MAELEANARSAVDFLSSFSIENRMGLKILIDKWLLQQSLFRGKFTKIATYPFPNAGLWHSPSFSCYLTSASTTCW